MRGDQDFQGAMFSDIRLEERVPQAHPLRKLRAVVDALLATMNREFEAVYARRGRRNRSAEATGRLVCAKSAPMMRSIINFSTVC
jgi:hypothetical protein